MLLSGTSSSVPSTVILAIPSVLHRPTAAMTTLIWRPGTFALHALLQLQDAVEHRLRMRRTSRNVDVDGDDRVDALHDGVVVIWASRACAGAEGHHPAWLRHLAIDALE